MAGRIRLLPDDLINRIAAGEVVERPGSILKELVENSLDAGADRIEVEAEAGGKRLIRVADNGSGMDEDELLMCLRRHATSKLDPESDLTDIRTLGFRGEALPAIASVSRLTVTTSRGGAEGRKAEVEGGKLLSVYPAPANRGTTVEVRDIFFNTPARRKFLKTVPTEEAHLADACQRYALSRPGLALTLHCDGRELIRVAPGESFRGRLREALGYLAEGLIEFDRDNGKGSRVRGAVSGPELSARSGADLFVFVCGRPVKDRLLTRAVIQGYGRTLPAGRYPAGAVFIDVDPAEVDVNVHPAKTEVRFRNSGAVFSAISDAVAKAVTAPLAVSAPPDGDRDALPDDGWGAGGFGSGAAADGEAIAVGIGTAGGGTEGGPMGGGASSGNGGTADAASGKAPESERAVPLPSTGQRSWAGPRLPRPSGDGSPPAGSAGGPSPAGAAPWLPRTGGPGGPGRVTAGADGATGGIGAGVPDGDTGETGGPDAALDSVLGIRHAGAGEPMGEAPDVPKPEWSKVLDDGGPPALKPIAQIAKTYILAEAPDGLRIIDQHAAHERILFNRLKRVLERDGLPSQSVLIPDTFELTPHERAALERMKEPLEHLGFRLEPFGDATWVLKGIPKILTPRAAAEALREMLSGARGSYGQLDGAGTGETIRDVSEAWLHSVACRAAIKAGHDLTREDMERLLQDMYEAEAGGYCPHGRPSSLSVTYRELEKKFGRK
ncbi:MAG: DNA mismatch repair endonuclease MutL [Deltaproteobacteria bacterium]|jgi:DNA mismatch repair protein MutL|nr:DNA mismatch repair endonuclease MutL [Deltaproteobacteria bacterium]